MVKTTASSAKWAASLALLLPLLVVCDRFLDEPLALLVKENLSGDAVWARRSALMPDLLLQLVFLTSVPAWVLYLLRSRKGIHDLFNRFLILTAWASPVSYLVKAALKPVFGRYNNRHWLEHPEGYGFHWFTIRPGYDAFPSGHMLVVVTLMAVTVRCYPRMRALCLPVALFLAGALMVTGFHFLSDILAGAYLGIALEALLFRLLSRTDTFSPDLADP